MSLNDVMNSLNSTDGPVDPGVHAAVSLAEDLIDQLPPLIISNINEA